jgi:hypothetical protein
VIANQNLKKPNFRMALLDALERNGLIGVDSKVSKVLINGLEAVKLTKFGLMDDYMTRLSYAQEINKISGVYAPEKRESKNLNLNIDISPEELDQRIANLTQELNS